MSTQRRVFPEPFKREASDQVASPATNDTSKQLSLCIMCSRHRRLGRSKGLVLLYFPSRSRA